MSEHDTSTSFFAKHDQLVIAQEELNPKLRSYVKFLATHHPFVKDMKLDRHQLMTRLAEIWPADPEWLPQMKEVWKLIDDIVHTVPSLTINHDILLRISVSGSTLDPARTPKSQEAAALATIDATQGVLRSCLVNALEKPASLDSLIISSGMMLVCQPQGHLPDPFVDYRDELSVGASENLFEERHEDKLIKGYAPAATPYLKPDPIREKFEAHQKHHQEWDLLHLKVEQEKHAFEEASKEADVPASGLISAKPGHDLAEKAHDAAEQLSHVPLHHHIYRAIGLMPANKPDNQPANEKPEATPKRNNLLNNIMRFTRGGGDDYRDG